MLRFLKWVKVGFWALLFVVMCSALVTMAVHRHHHTPTWESITATNNISPALPTSIHHTVRKSRESAVLVRSRGLDFWSGSSTMSGTYFTANEKHYVITANHGIIGPCWLLVVFHKDDMVTCREVVASNEDNDYAIVEIERSPLAAKAVRIPQDLPHGGEWRSSYSLLNTIIYTGYPNTIGPLTLRGDVVGYGERETLYIFSHAYGGASGSGVFTQNGKYIGYIVAIDVGQTEWGIDVLENIVLVAPAFNVDWSVVLN